MSAPRHPRLLVGALALGVALLPPRPAAARRAPHGHASAPTVDVEAMGALAPAATLAMRERMREHVQRQVRPLVEGHLLTSPRGYLVDGSIDALDVVASAGAIQISCSVRLILSARRSGAMLVMTTGHATLTDAHRALKPAALARLQLEALDGAVRAASDELASHFARRSAT